MDQNPPRPNPYVGPRAFRIGEILYGRDRELRQLLDLLVAERIVLLHSPSGAGKTSLIQAGLIPSLISQGFNVKPVIRLNQPPPQEVDQAANSNRYLFSAILSLEENSDLQGESHSLASLASMTLGEYLDQSSQEDVASTGEMSFAYREAPRQDEVLIFDQFEEILTIETTDLAGKQAFFEQLGEALRDRQRWALFAMREDYMPALAPYLRSIPTRLRTTYRLDLLGVSAALQAIQAPPRSLGVEFTQEAARQLVDDLRRVQVQMPDGSLEQRPGPYIEPVQLQVVCYRLWQNLAPDDREINTEDLENVGDVNSSLAAYYAEQVAEAAQMSGVQERAIREWFQGELITSQGIRNQVAMGVEASGGLPNATIFQLVDAHLIRSEKRGGTTWFELSHDRLVSPIREDNTAWLDTHLSLLQKQAALWNRQGRPESMLLRGSELSQASKWTMQHSEALLPVEVEYLHNSQALFERDRRARWLNRIIAILGVIAIVLAGIAFIAYQNAQRQARTARAGQLAAQSQAALEDYPLRSMLLAVEANSIPYPGEPRLPAVEESLRAAAKDSRGIPVQGQDFPVRQITASPDGHWLATGAEDGNVRLWDTRAGPGALADNPIVLTGHNQPIQALAFSPDGHWLAAGSQDETAILWEVDTLQPNANPIVLPGNAGGVNALAYSPDSRWLATGAGDGTTWIWDLSLNHPDVNPSVLPALSGWVQTLSFSPDGRWLAAGGANGALRLWDLNDPAIRYLDLPSHQQLVTSVAFSPDGRWLASGSQDKTILLWELSNADPAQNPILLQGFEDWVNALAFSPDGRWLAAGSGDDTARLWDLAPTSQDQDQTGLANPAGAIQNPIILTGHLGPIKSLAFSPDGHWLATGSNDRTARLWDMSAPSPGTNPQVLHGHDDWVNALAFSADSQWLATGGQDANVRLWLLDTTGPVNNFGGELNPLVLQDHSEAVNILAYSPDGSWLASGGQDGTLHLWPIDSAGGQVSEPINLPGHTAWIQSLAISPDAHWLASGAGDGGILLWDLTAANPAASSISLVGHQGEVKALAFSPDGHWLASGGADQTARLWDLTAADPGQNLQVLAGHEGEINSLAFSPEGRWLATGSADNTARLWDLNAPNPSKNPHILAGHQDDIFALAFSPDGHWLATASGDKTARLWDITSTEPADNPHLLAGHTDQVKTLAFSPDGHWLATGSWDDTLRLWDMQAANPAEHTFELRGHNDWVNALAFSPDSQWLASGSQDQTARLWNLAVPDPSNPAVNPVVLSDYKSGVPTLAFSPDSRWLATGSGEGNTRLWLVQISDLENIACRSVGRNLTPAEWQQYFPGTASHAPTCPQWPPEG
jgi:WD40 repeat protein